MALTDNYSWNSSDTFSREDPVEKPISFSGPSVLTLVGALSSWVRVNHILHGFFILGSILMKLLQECTLLFTRALAIVLESENNSYTCNLHL